MNTISGLIQKAEQEYGPSFSKTAIEQKFLTSSGFSLTPPLTKNSTLQLLESMLSDLYPVVIVGSSMHNKDKTGPRPNYHCGVSCEIKPRQTIYFSNQKFENALWSRLHAFTNLNHQTLVELGNSVVGMLFVTFPDTPEIRTELEETAFAWEVIPIPNGSILLSHRALAASPNAEINLSAPEHARWVALKTKHWELEFSIVNGPHDEVSINKTLQERNSLARDMELFLIFTFLKYVFPTAEKARLNLEFTPQ